VFPETWLSLKTFDIVSLEVPLLGASSSLCGSSGQPPCGTAAHDPGIEHNNLPLRAEQSSSETARIRG
jgi:hypothetical protein